MTFYFQFRRWALHWQIFGFDAYRSRSVIGLLKLKRGHTDWYGWMICWDERPDWKHFPTNGALRIECTVRERTTAYVFRGPIERISPA